MMDDPNEAKKFSEVCIGRLITPGKTTIIGETFMPPEAWALKYCRDLIKARLDFAEKQYLDIHVISFPGGFAKLHTSDLGIMGNVGILLLLTWSFYSSRRENHAIQAFVDMDARDRRTNRWLPSEFTLSSIDPTLSAEHIAYAYHAVAQRFVFLFSSYSKPLLTATIGLFTIPFIVSLINFATDIRDVIGTRWEISIYIRVGVEFLLVLGVFILTLRIILFAKDTSILLNGWYLAVNDVWMKDWNEETSDPARDVKINVSQQSATRKE